MENNVYQLGALAIVFALAIREFFSYLKTKKPNGGSEVNGNGKVSYVMNEQILAELRLMNSNHLHSIEDAVRTGNEKLVESIHNDNIKIIELLGEIKGQLHSR